MPALAQNRVSGASADPRAEAHLEALLKRLYGFYHEEIDLSLDRVNRFLARLGDPHLRLPPVIHVAGTNGKGSVVATLRALLEASGKTVHVATSPHLVHATERIRLAGQFISTEALNGLLEECLAVNRDEPITFFEMFMAATFLAFARTPADYCLLETGMGGRLDATNVVPDPACTVITVISRDHEMFLGSDLRDIAAEKAGIMKPGVPCIIGPQTEEGLRDGVLEVFHTASQKLSTGAPLLVHGAEWVSAPEGSRMRFAFENESYLLPRPGLPGSHQIGNAGAALAAYRVISGQRLDAGILSTALGQIEWPGRLQTLEKGNLSGLLPRGWELVIDGGHNDSAGMVLAEQARAWRAQDGKQLHVILAMIRSKTPPAFLQPLVPYVESVTATLIPGEANSFTPDALKERIQALNIPKLAVAESAEAAIRSVLAGHNDEPGRILITGSLYFLGTILKQERLKEEGRR